MTARGQRDLAAASAVFLGLILWAVYLAWRDLPLVHYAPPEKLKPFMVIYPVVASLGLVYWSLARGGLGRPLLRYLLGGLNTLVAIFSGAEVYQRMTAGGGLFDGALMPVLFALFCALTAWTLLQGPEPGCWRHNWLVAAAGVQIVAAPALFFILSISDDSSLADILIVLLLALLPFALVLIGRAVVGGRRWWCLPLALLYGALTLYHLWAALGSLGQDASGVKGLVAALAVALMAAFLAVINALVLRRDVEPTHGEGG
jgi:hypothetical protein